MKKGKIIEEGNHESLLQQYPDGLYAKFVKEQENSEHQQNEEQPIHVEKEAEEYFRKRSNSSRSSTFIRKRNAE